MEVKLLKGPTEEDLMLVKRAVWATMGETGEPKNPPTSQLLSALLRARHSPIRLLWFVFMIEDIPSNTSVHLCRHVHSVPFCSSLRNDRQEKLDGDAARRDTPICMMYAVNAEELMVIANKRLCMKAAEKTREVVRMMCDKASEALPEIKPYLVPNCIAHGGVCNEIESCGLCPRD